MTLPNFLVIGAHKGASTSLRAYLGEHPDVYIAPALEPSFFALAGKSRYQADGSLTRPDLEPVGATYTLAEYEALFAGVTTERAIGEKSPAYLTNRDAPGRIKEMIPDVRLIAVLRNPIERAFSHYLMEVRAGSEDLPFADAIAAEFNKQRTPVGTARHYARSGRYSKRIQRYLSLFEPKQLRIYLFEDLVADSLSVVQEMYEHIGVDPSFQPDLSRRHNARPAEDRQSLPRFRPRLTRSSPKEAARTSSSAPEMSPETRRELLDFYREDITTLQSLIGRDLSAWLV